MGRPKKKKEPIEIVRERVLDFGELPVSKQDVQESAAEDLEGFREFERDRRAENEE